MKSSSDGSRKPRRARLITSSDRGYSYLTSTLQGEHGRTNHRGVTVAGVCEPVLDGAPGGVQVFILAFSGTREGVQVGIPRLASWVVECSRLAM